MHERWCLEVMMGCFCCGVEAHREVNGIGAALVYYRSQECGVSITFGDVDESPCC